MSMSNPAEFILAIGLAFYAGFKLAAYLGRRK